MSRIVKAIFVIVLVAGLISTAMPAFHSSAHGQEHGPSDILQAVYDAVAADDIDAAMDLVAEDVVLVIMPPPPGHDGIITGKEETRAWFEGLKENFSYTSVDFSDIQENGNRATWKANWPTDDFAVFGLDAVEFEGSNIVQDGLLRQHTWIFSEAFQAKLAAASTVATNRTNAQRFMNEVWDQGKLEVVDEIVAADFVNYSPPPGLGADREGLKADVASFHANFPDHSARFRIDDLIVTDKRAVIRNTMMIKSADSGEEMEGDVFIVVLGMQDGLIVDRWLGWATCGGQPTIAACFGPVTEE